MSSQPRPKRAGEDFTRTHHHDEDDLNGPSEHKKPRFDLRNPSNLAPDALDDDPVLDADEIGRRGQQVRRKAVNLDGYDSDSENEGFSARIEAKAKRSRAKHDAEDDDMFAELQEDFGAEEIDADEALRKNKKTVRFLRDDEIEGQVASSKGGVTLRADLNATGDTVEEDEVESESDVADEDRARLEEGMDEELGAGAKKKHAPLLDAFNMRAEQEEGKFDDQGNYIRKAADPDEIYDSWLEGDPNNSPATGRNSSRGFGKDRQSGSKETEMASQEEQEPVEAKRAQPEDTEMTEDDPNEASRKQAIETITGAADILMTRGQTDIYDTEREMLKRQYRQETGEDWVDPPSESAAPTGAEEEPVMWQFRWSDARDGGVEHGPYDSQTMESWKSAGYFGEGVEFRKVGDTGDWTSEAAFL
ncbi:GYF domain-containing protein [Aspergillus novofumigatus IBT 16806]|uniref:GYF domain-containing protein n=1 Tax=Aspergillus novofumigatus (strain IBT 16806) TaxID=1392255 RepID=A0A2I1BWI5_ASPN1|nr:uncharacterized protein P174DRAFT_424911 [Aspergillus novofumigatus IBT 16806]PKX89739.1 hypothetical protein P174DRAFT_424911 [Aspergillus novofumigatus IBT 16806]